MTTPRHQTSMLCRDQRLSGTTPPARRQRVSHAHALDEHTRGHMGCPNMSCFRCFRVKSCMGGTTTVCRVCVRTRTTHTSNAAFVGIKTAYSGQVRWVSLETGFESPVAVDEYRGVRNTGYNPTTLSSFLSAYCTIKSPIRRLVYRFGSWISPVCNDARNGQNVPW